MKIMLLYPPLSAQERFSSALGKAGGYTVPLGIFYLASILRKNEYNVKVMDAEAQNFDSEKVLAEMTDFKPDVLGISSTTVAFHRAVEIAEIVSNKFPHIQMILGGPHITTNPKEILKSSVFNLGVVGEGEVTILELLEAFRNKTFFENIKGIVFKKNNEIIETERREFINDLDILPFPAYDLIPDISVYTPPPGYYRKLPVANVITSRGCPYRCVFCDRAIFGQNIRQRSPQNIASEIIQLFRKHGINEIDFIDDTFTIKNNRIRELFAILDKENIHFSWRCRSRVNTVDEDILKFMKSKGCYQISFGIESGNQEILKNLKKGITLEQIRKTISVSHKLGIKTSGYFMVGNLGETKQTMEQTIKFAKKLPLDDVAVSINTPLPGSEEYEIAYKWGKLGDGEMDLNYWRKFNTYNPVFVPNGLTEQDIFYYHKKFYRNFYLRPKIIFAYMCRIFSSGGIIRLLKTIPFLFGKKQ